MNIVEALSIVSKEVFAKEKRHLSDTEKTILQGAWDGKTYEEMAQTSSYTVNYLKNDAGPNFWKLLTQILGEKVNKTNWRAVLERQRNSQAGQVAKHKKLTLSNSDPELIVAQSKHNNSGDEQRYTNEQIDWGEAPNVGVFYGRTLELDRLNNWIVDRHGQLAALVGLKGIGKTALAVKLVERIQTEFDYVIWRSLNYNPPPPLENIVADFIIFLSKQEKITLPETINSRVSLLIKYLRKYRCLLVLDNADSLMQAGYRSGHYQENYEEYGEFLKRVGTERHRSCLVLTSRENPKELVTLEAEALPVCSFRFQGLKEEEAKKLFDLKGLSDPEYWEEVIKMYEGNPLALQIVSSTIQNFFGGKVSDFIKQKTISMRTIDDLLEQQFRSLSSLEVKIIYLLVSQQKGISFSELKKYIDISGSELMNVLEFLRRRSLIQGEALFTPDPIVKQYIINKLGQEELTIEAYKAKENMKKLISILRLDNITDNNTV